jgi:uncharacterized protein (TIGR03437 family)
MQSRGLISTHGRRRFDTASTLGRIGSIGLLIALFWTPAVWGQNVNFNSYYRLSSQLAVGKSLAVRLTGDSSTARVLMAPTNNLDPFQMWAVEKFGTRFVITNYALGRTWALALDSNNFRLTMERRSLNATDQRWSTAALNEFFQLRNNAAPGRSLESLLETPQMDPTASVTGQAWSFNLVGAIPEPTNVTGTTVRIKNRWKGTYIFENNGTVTANTIPVTDNRSHWQVKHMTGAGDVDAKSFVLENKATGRWLNLENPVLAASTPCNGCVSARWFVEPVSNLISSDVGGPWWRLSNAWEGAGNAALHTENSNLETGVIGAPGWISAQWTFEVVATNPLLLSCTPTTGPANASVAYTSTCTASGGLAPYSFTNTTPLPPGLQSALTSPTTAVISGTPTNAGPYNYTLFVRDSSTPQLLSSVNFTGTIAALAGTLTIAPSTLSNAVLGAPYNAKLTASGGTAPYAFSLASGTLPQGLTLASDGTITGTTSQLVPFPSTFTVRVTDASGLTATQPYTLIVQAAFSITSVKSASDFGGGYDYIAAGSWIEIRGTGFSLATRTWQGSDFEGAQAPTSLDGVRVTVNGRPAFLYYISPSQINAQAPDDATVGPVVVRVGNATGEASLTVNKRSTAPALLAPPAFRVGGRQYVVAQFADLFYVGRVGLVLGAAFRPAKPGDSITIYGVGFGDVSPAIAPGIVVASPNSVSSPLTVAFGEIAAETLYKGLAPGFVGLYQFNITVPQVADGDHEIRFMLNGQALPQPPVYLTVQR